MFDALTDRLTDTLRKLRGRGRITEANVREAMREVRTALLEADVNVGVVREFCDRVLDKALGAEVIKTLHPEQVMVKVVHDELVSLLGPVDPRIPYVSPPPTVILIAGLNGAGKTTTCAKLAGLIRKQGHQPLLVAADLQRPAAIDQLEVLANQVGVGFYGERDTQNPVKVCRRGIDHARQNSFDVVILDSAGRQAVDEEMMQQISRVATTIQPHQIYLVCDAMTGQDAVNSSKAFNERLELDGVILTKFDSDTRGGAVLSVKKVTGKPIKFIGTGEKLDAIESFHPDRMAGRILAMGDMVTLVEKAQEQYDADAAARLQQKMAKGNMGLEDFLEQLKAMQKMGGMKDVMKMIPGVGSELKHMDLDEDEIKRSEAIILSMTPRERSNPSIVDASRRRRIARGSGCQPEDVSGLTKSFLQVRDLMKAMSGMGMRDRMRMGSQLAQLSLSGGALPKIKARSQKKRVLNRRDRRKQRKRRSR